jgi:hypothetical protein
MNPIKLGVYHHYNGNQYRAVGFADHTEPLKIWSFTKLLRGGHGTWVRPLSMLETPIDIDGKTMKRFEYVSESGEAGSRGNLRESLRAINSTSANARKRGQNCVREHPNTRLLKDGLKCFTSLWA